MKLKDYLEKINNLVATFPEALEMDVIYAENGERFELIKHDPEIGTYHSNTKNFFEEDETSERFNAVCVN